MGESAGCEFVEGFVDTYEGDDVEVDVASYLGNIPSAREAVRLYIVSSVEGSFGGEFLAISWSCCQEIGCSFLKDPTRPVILKPVQVAQRDKRRISKDEKKSKYD
ncbi:hypothetical protein N7490_006915 [Penicillium lividum]|nr:hypothetical protein N7490_006915 [Penicillium lividum]